jgi:hypothetical protein
MFVQTRDVGSISNVISSGMKKTFGTGDVCGAYRKTETRGTRNRRRARPVTRCVPQRTVTIGSVRLPRHDQTAAARYLERRQPNRRIGVDRRRVKDVGMWIIICDLDAIDKSIRINNGNNQPNIVPA